jgi:DNA polymerase III gamma/tau subunit
MRDRDALISRLLAIAPGDTVAAFALAAELAELKPALPTVFEVLSRLYRDLLLLRTGTAAALGLSNPDLAAPLAATAERLGVEAILQRLELIADTRYGLLERNLNPRLSLERLIGALTSAAGDEGTFVQARRAV